MPSNCLAVISSLETPWVFANTPLPILGATERDVMLLMWNQDYRAAREIIPYFRQRHTHATQTVNIILVRLSNKGVLRQESPPRGKRPYSYTPTLTKADYLVQDVERLLHTVDTTHAEREYVVRSCVASIPLW